MPFKDNGYIEVRPTELAWIEIHDADTRETIYEPTVEDIIDVCKRYGFDVEKTLDIIRKRNKDVYGILFDAEIYRNS